MTKTSDKVCDQNRDGTRTIQIGDFLYSFGGWTAEDKGATYNDIYVSGDLTEWRKLGNASWPPRHTFGLNRLEDKIFVYGTDEQAKGQMDMWISYDQFKGQNWSDGSDIVTMNYRKFDLSLIPRRVLYGSCSDGAYIYLIGGHDTARSFRSRCHDVWRFDGNEWERMGDGLAAFEKNLSGACCYYNKKLWVISGGVYGTYTGTKTVYSSQDYGANWRREQDVPFAGRYYHDTIVWDEKLWVIGGVGGEKKANMNDIWFMDTKAWHLMDNVHPDFSPRHASGVAVYNDKLVITNGNYHNDCWVIEKI